MLTRNFVQPYGTSLTLVGRPSVISCFGRGCNAVGFQSDSTQSNRLALVR